MTICAVICTYNRLDYLETAIQSVITQTRPADEIIVVFDGGNFDHFEYFQAKYPTVRCYFQENQGRSIAANRAVYESTCEYIAFLDDDDYWFPEKLKTVANVISATHAEAINHFYKIVDEDNVITLPNCDHMLVRNELNPHLVVRNPCAFSTTVVSRRTYMISGGLAPFQTIADDWTLYMNIARIAKWTTLSERLCCYRVHKSQVSSDDSVGLRILSQIIAYYNGGRPSKGLKSDVMAKDIPIGVFEHAGISIWKSLRSAKFRRAYQTWCAVTLLVGHPFVAGKLVFNFPPIRHRITRYSDICERFWSTKRA